LDFDAIVGGTNCPSEGSSTMQTVPHATPKPAMQTLRVLTYNVHSCRGTDRRHDPVRIAEVIAGCAPDVIALQELDVGRARTGGIDQAKVIADHLKMQAHFHPALHVEEEKYGDAILTALPSRFVRAAALPSIGEPRGAIWVEIDIAGEALQVINTHFGLRRRERTAQAAALLGPDWLGHERCRTNPTLLVGDLNAVPSSSAYDLLARQLRAAAAPEGRRPKATFPSRFPLLRLDHVFINDRLDMTGLDVVDNALARRASDHLPLLAQIGLEAGITNHAAEVPEPLEFTHTDQSIA
jgi:endonuclease/exonuclease/phosphatase family metal-dependent hydrolase